MNLNGLSIGVVRVKDATMAAKNNKAQKPTDAISSFEERHYLPHKHVEHDARRARRLVLRVACRRRWQNNSNHTKQTKDGQCAAVRGTAYKRLRRVAAAGGGWQPPAGHQNESGTSVAYEL